MKALILLGTLKGDGLSNTETLSDFHSRYLKEQGVECETIKLVNERILPGTYTNMGEGDAWPQILKKIEEASILIFATPIWWGNHSSETQKVIERLDEIHDQILEGKKSLLADKVAGVIITGDSDGAQHIIGSICNFLNAIGVIVPPYSTLSVVAEEQKKGSKATREELMEKYEKEYAKTAETMAKQLVSFAKK